MVEISRFIPVAIFWALAGCITATSPETTKTINGGVLPEDYKSVRTPRALAS
jgi:hypothetical protein